MNNAPGPLQIVPIVHILDDDESIRDLVAELARSVGIEPRAYSSAQDFFEVYRPSPIECLIADIRMPGMSGLEVQRRLLEREFSMPIIFVTGFGGVDTAVEAMRQGALDYIEKPFAPQSLLDKIQAALERSRALHREHLEQVMINARLALLTPKEREVVLRVVAGKSSREIADEFGLSVRTIENHRARIMEKLRADSVVDLVRLLGPRLSSGST